MRKPFDKCICFHEIKSQRPLTDFERALALAEIGEIPKYMTQIKTVCWGTAECEECKCNGDKKKCDFYPEPKKEETK